MSALRHAAQQALEALKRTDSRPGTEASARENAAITALRDALTQPFAEHDRLYAQHASVVSDYEKAVAALKAQRDALLEALKLARSIIGHPDDAHSQMIDAAIKAVEGEKE